MTATTGPRRYSDEFKTDAVVRARLGQETINEIAADLGVSPSTLRSWVSKAPAAAAPSTVKEGPAVAPRPAAEVLDPNGCRACGRTPAVDVTFRSVQGMVIMFKHWKHTGRFCRDCGRELGRDVMDRTLLRGWWGFISFFFNWFAVVTNLVGFRKLAALGAPEGEPRQAVKVGKPMYKRAGVYVMAVVVLVVGGVALADTSTKSEDFAGKCVKFSADRAKVSTVKSCNDTHDGKVIAVVDRGAQCPEFAEGAVSLKSDSNKDMCIDLDQ